MKTNTRFVLLGIRAVVLWSRVLARQMLQPLAFARSRIHTEIDSMTGATEQGTSFDCLQDTLQIAHRGRIFDLTVSHREGGVDLAGDAVSYHAVQLVIRDVLAAGVRIRRNHIRVRPLARS